MFSLIHDDGGGDASPLETRVDITPPQAVFTVLEFETFYKLSKFFIHDNSHHEALVKIFDIRSELVDIVQRDDGIYARMVRVAAAGNRSQVRFSRHAFRIVDNPSALLEQMVHVRGHLRVVSTPRASSCSGSRPYFTVTEETKALLMHRGATTSSRRTYSRTRALPSMLGSTMAS
jgi:hypothetical protein